MSVEGTLKTIADQFETFLRDAKDRDEQRDEMMAALHLTVYGDGNGNPGLRIRTDRLEHKHDNLRKDFDEKTEVKKAHWFAIWGAIVTAIATAMASLFQKAP